MNKEPKRGAYSHVSKWQSIYIQYPGLNFAQNSHRIIENRTNDAFGHHLHSPSPSLLWIIQNKLL